MARPREAIEHGTIAGYLKEHRRGMEKCQKCLDAWNDYYGNYRYWERENAAKNLSDEQHQEVHEVPPVVELAVRGGVEADEAG